MGFAALICLFPMLLYVLLITVSRMILPGETVACFLVLHFPGAVGIPTGIIAALTIVMLLATSISGDFKLELWKLTLSGPSAPIMMWVVCFLAIALALETLLPTYKDVDSMPPALKQVCVVDNKPARQSMRPTDKSGDSISTVERKEPR